LGILSNIRRRLQVNSPGPAEEIPQKKFSKSQKPRFPRFWQPD